MYLFCTHISKDRECCLYLHKNQQHSTKYVHNGWPELAPPHLTRTSVTFTIPCSWSPNKPTLTDIWILTQVFSPSIVHAQTLSPLIGHELRPCVWRLVSYSLITPAWTSLAVSRCRTLPGKDWPDACLNAIRLFYFTLFPVTFLPTSILTPYFFCSSSLPNEHLIANYFFPTNLRFATFIAKLVISGTITNVILA